MVFIASTNSLNSFSKSFDFNFFWSESFSESKISNVYYEHSSNDFNTFDELWTENEINIIVLLFKEISHLAKITKNKNLYMSDLFVAYSDAIHSILLVKDQEVKKRIKKSTNRI